MTGTYQQEKEAVQLKLDTELKAKAEAFAKRITEIYPDGDHADILYKEVVAIVEEFDDTLSEAHRRTVAAHICGILGLSDAPKASAPRSVKLNEAARNEIALLQVKIDRLQADLREQKQLNAKLMAGSSDVPLDVAAKGVSAVVSVGVERLRQVFSVEIEEGVIDIYACSAAVKGGARHHDDEGTNVCVAYPYSGGSGRTVKFVAAFGLKDTPETVVGKGTALVHEAKRSLARAKKRREREARTKLSKRQADFVL